MERSGLLLFWQVVERSFQLVYGLGVLLNAAEDAAPDLGFAAELIERW
jgi:hypothetical protein